MMFNLTRAGRLLLPVVAGLSPMLGCTLTVPVDVELQAELAEFAVSAGEPKQNTGLFNIELGRRVGSGSLSINPEAVSLMPADEAGNKSLFGSRFQTVDVETCLAACDLAGVSEDRCANVCENRELEITVWIGNLEESDTVCTTGDQYGPFRIGLDENGVPVTVVSPTRAPRLTERTVGLLNAGSFSACIRVISPISGTVMIESLRIRVGL